MNNFPLIINYRYVYTSRQFHFPAFRAHRASSEEVANWLNVPFHVSPQNASL